MEPVIWVELLSRHRDVAARYRLAGPEVHIGRGYDNDVVVDDPFVAARHVRVFRDDAGRLVAEDLGSAGGMFLDRDKSRRERIAIDGERPIRIGHTYLRIRDAHHAVASERVGKQQARLLPIALAAALGAAILGIETLSEWFAETGEPRLTYYLTPLFGVVLMVVVWVALWAILSRIFSGRARFERNLVIALLGFLFYSLYHEFAQFSAFALTWRVPAGYEYVAMWCALAAACFFHLREANPSALKLKGGIVGALLTLVLAVQTLAQSEARADFGQQSYLRRLLPPVLRLAPVQDENSFFAEIERLKTTLDRDRAETPGDESGR